MGDKLREPHLKWSRHVQRRPTIALLRKYFSVQVDTPPMRRGRLKRTWMKVVRINHEDCNLFEDLAQDKLEWRNIIHVANPNIVGIRL